MPLVALHLYADGLSAPSMLFWRYVHRDPRARHGRDDRGLELSRAGGTAPGASCCSARRSAPAQTLCFWESIKTLETSIAVLLFYTYPAVTLAIDRLVFKQPIRPLALLCIAAILCGAALITGPGLHGGTLDPRGLAWAMPAPLLYAVYLAINARLLRRHPPLIGATGLFIGMAVTSA